MPEVYDVVDSDAVRLDQLGPETLLYTPDGTIRLAVTDPVTTLPFTEVEGIRDYQAPEGASMIGLQWEGTSNPWPSDVAEILVADEIGTFPDDRDRRPSTLE